MSDNLTPDAVALNQVSYVQDGYFTSTGVVKVPDTVPQLGLQGVFLPTAVVDADGATLWEGDGLGVGRDATILGSDSLVHDAVERRRLRESSGADAVDMESGVLARSGRLAGVLRAISDDAGSAVEGVDRTVHADGRTNVAALLRWTATRRGDALRAMRGALRALKALEEAVAT